MDRTSKRLVLVAVISALCMVVALVLGARGSLADQLASVDAVRIGQQNAGTRFVMELDRRVPYQLFMLKDPYRVVIDMPEVRWSLPPGSGARKRGLIDGYRYGLFRSDVYRVVLDLAGPARVRRHFVLEPSGSHGYRMVFDLEPVLPGDFQENEHVKLAVAPPQQPQIGQMPRRRDGKRTVVIDPGHGGVDPGAIGRSGLYEKKVTLSTALKLKKELEKTGKYHVVLTRRRDIYVPLRDRVAIARRAGAELFLSIHADSIRNPKMRGASVYTLSTKASDAEAAELANRENQADVIAGVDLSNYDETVGEILIDLQMGLTARQSSRMQRLAIGQLDEAGRLLRKPARSAGFAVLKAPDVPSVLVELGFLSNRYDEKQLASTDHQANLAKALRRAVDAYFRREVVLHRS
ncbi:MAG: N-acetylmuramoyl-L-alanine amidase [Alphaproteobacteria bacterium]|nr:N-acetylmuramoyl-L-alanine amidase [Alphaproteobacteria bacterium]